MLDLAIAPIRLCRNAMMNLHHDDEDGNSQHWEALLVTDHGEGILRRMQDMLAEERRAGRERRQCKQTGVILPQLAQLQVSSQKTASRLRY